MVTHLMLVIFVNFVMHNIIVMAVHFLLVLSIVRHANIITFYLLIMNVHYVMIHVMGVILFRMIIVLLARLMHIELKLPVFGLSNAV